MEPPFTQRVEHDKSRNESPETMCELGISPGEVQKFPSLGPVVLRIIVHVVHNFFQTSRIRKMDGFSLWRWIPGGPHSEELHCALA